VSILAHSENDNKLKSALPPGKALILYMERIMLQNFRSYGSLSLDVGASSVVLTGSNGAGKTNLLEALSFLAPGRGLRGAKLSEVTRLGSGNQWAVSGRLQTPDGERQLGSGLVSRNHLASITSPDRRIGRLDGETLSSPAAFADVLQVAWLTPQMDRLFIEGPSGRRRFLDRLVTAYHPSHSRELNAYEKVMRERNRLLSEGHADISWVAALEHRMAEHGVAVVAARLDAIQKLSQAIMESRSAFPRAALSLEGDLESGLMTKPAIKVEEEFITRLSQCRKIDAKTGRTSVGPHKTDLRASHVEKDMDAELCSTGEQKALLIGITLASARLTASQFGAPPILLLDEVAAHLDENRRDSLFHELDEIGSQVWLTGTDVSLFERMKNRATFFHVKDGKIQAE
jgi:DNA replication and repair protein RecF